MFRRSGVRSGGRWAVPAVAALLVASCSGASVDPDAGSGGGSGTEDSNPVEIGMVASPDDDDDQATIVDLEQEWAGQRQRIVDSLTSDLYGVGEDGILRGPGQFEVDLDDCRGDWSDQAGIDETTIRVGLVAPNPGTLPRSPSWPKG